MNSPIPTPALLQCAIEAIEEQLADIQAVATAGMIVAEAADDGSDERQRSTEYRLLRSVGLLAGDAAPLTLLRDALAQPGKRAD